MLLLADLIIISLHISRQISLETTDWTPILVHSHRFLYLKGSSSSPPLLRISSLSSWLRSGVTSSVTPSLVLRVVSDIYLCSFQAEHQLHVIKDCCILSLLFPTSSRTPCPRQTMFTELIQSPHFWIPHPAPVTESKSISF